MTILKSALMLSACLCFPYLASAEGPTEDQEPSNKLKPVAEATKLFSGARSVPENWTKGAKVLLKAPDVEELEFLVKKLGLGKKGAPSTKLVPFKMPKAEAPRLLIDAMNLLRKSQEHSAAAVAWARDRVASGKAVEAYCFLPMACSADDEVSINTARIWFAMARGVDPCLYRCCVMAAERIPGKKGGAVLVEELKAFEDKKDFYHGWHDVREALVRMTGNPKAVMAADFSKILAGEKLENVERVAGYGPIESLVYGRVYGQGIVFIIDISHSMVAKGTPKAMSSDSGSKWEGARIDLVKKEMEDILSKLPPETKFNIINFCNLPLPWKTQLVSASPENIAEAKKFVHAIEAIGATNVSDTLHMVLGMAGVDAIYFMGDGIPSRSQIDMDAILYDISVANLQKNIRINTTAMIFGSGPYDDLEAEKVPRLKAFLENLALYNHGEHLLID
ncbi:MAG: hypothetical protein AB7F75_03135 [Planctomycetota bacterium]